MEEDLKRNFDLGSFKAAKERMLATNDTYFGKFDNRRWLEPVRDYTEEEVKRIINNGSLEEKIKLSRNYFRKDGFYKQIILHYANLLCYYGVLIPHPNFGQKLSTSHIAKRYDSALNLIETINVPTFCAECATKALVEGAYYGVIVQNDKNSFATLDLPFRYCRTRFKDTNNNNIVEFNVDYFLTIPNLEDREAILKGYPEFIQKAYWDSKKHGSVYKWVMIPSDVGICFPIFDSRPLLLSVIPATIAYDKAIANELERQAEEIRKIIVQQIPHLSDGRLLFEPEEAAEIHSATAGMLKNNKNINVLTSYGEVNAITSNGGMDAQNRTTIQMQDYVYANAGVSQQLFNATGSSSMEYSLDNDLSIMMYITNKMETFLTNIVNRTCGNANIQFSYKILPVTYYNQKDYIDEYLKMAQYGYSAMMPAIASGISQKDFIALKDLENDTYDLVNSKLIPLQSANTQAGGENEDAGRPKTSQKNKAAQTIRNETSKDSGGSTQ